MVLFVQVYGAYIAVILLLIDTVWYRDVKALFIVSLSQIRITAHLRVIVVLFVVPLVSVSASVLPRHLSVP